MNVHNNKEEKNVSIEFPMAPPLSYRLGSLIPNLPPRFVRSYSSNR
jgi:hypothetical protein